MKNITVSVDDKTYRQARVRAAELDTSVSELVRGFLQTLERGDSEFERLAKLELGLRKRVKAFSAGDRLSRDELHERRR